MNITATMQDLQGYENERVSMAKSHEEVRARLSLALSRCVSLGLSHPLTPKNVTSLGAVVHAWGDDGPGERGCPGY